MRRTTSICTLIVALIFAGCGPSNPPSPNPSAPKAIRIGVVLPMFRHPFFVAMRDAINAEAVATGVEVDVRDGQDDDQKQIIQAQALISSRVDALVLCPRDENAALAAVEAADRAQVPIVTVNRRINGGRTVTYIGADDAEGGRAQGEALVQALGAKGGKIVYLQGTPGSSPQVSRNKGLREAIDKHPEIVVVADQFTDFQEDKAKAVMSGIVQRFHPGEIRAIVAQADELALPASEVATEAGWKGMIVIGFNGTKPAFDAIRNGTMHATILQDPAEQARAALHSAIDLARGKTISGDLTTPLPVITKENVEKFKPSY